MARLIYTALFYLCVPLFIFHLLSRGRKAPAYLERWGERFAVNGVEMKRCIWVHAVSMGEVIASIPLVERLLVDYPHLPLLITTTTPTGSERVKAAFGDRVQHVYCPYDLPGPVNRFLDAVNPVLLVIMETELWPNLLHYSAKRGIPIVLANARLSARSAKGYQRVHWLTRPMLEKLDMVAAQAQPDGDRFLSLGLKKSHLAITGSVKFDLKVDAALLARAEALRAQLGRERAVWIAASTHEGEEALVLSAFADIRKQVPHCLLVLVPRHPERFTAAAELVASQQYAFLRRSEQREQSLEVPAEIDVLVGDTMGELLLLYAASDVAFVGGSLVPRGGHNMLEPLSVGVPIIAGPHLFNFQFVSQQLTERGYLQSVRNAAELGAMVTALFSNEAQRHLLAEQGKEFIAANRGALEKLVGLVKPFLPTQPVPVERSEPLQPLCEEGD